MEKQEQRVFFKPTINHIVNGLNAMEAQFDLLLAMAIELGVDDEMELLIGLIPQCRDAVSQHYADMESRKQVDI